MLSPTILQTSNDVKKMYHIVYDIAYDVAYDISYDIIYDIVYDIVNDMTFGKPKKTWPATKKSLAGHTKNYYYIVYDAIYIVYCIQYRILCRVRFCILRCRTLISYIIYEIVCDV